MRKADRTFTTLIDVYPPEVKMLALATREFILELLPAAEESVDTSGPYVFYGYGPGYKGAVCNLSVSKTGVKLGLVRGFELDDPKGLLKGAGKVHRHVPLRTPADLRQPGLRPLVKAALAAWQRRNEHVRSN